MDSTDQRRSNWCGKSKASASIRRNCASDWASVAAFKAATEAQSDAQFLLMDAEALDFPHQFDLLWSVESISHYHDRRGFFANAVQFLKPGGVFALTDWFKRSGLSPAQT